MGFLRIFLAYYDPTNQTYRSDFPTRFGSIAFFIGKNVRKITNGYANCISRELEFVMIYIGLVDVSVQMEILFCLRILISIVH